MCMRKTPTLQANIPIYKHGITRQGEGLISFQGSRRQATWLASARATIGLITQQPEGMHMGLRNTTKALPPPRARRLALHEAC